MKFDCPLARKSCMSLKLLQEKVDSARPFSVVKNGASSMTKPRTMSGTSAVIKLANKPPDECPEMITGCLMCWRINQLISVLMAVAEYFAGFLLEPPCP